MNWNNISLKQYNDIVNINTKDSLDRTIEIMNIIYNEDCSKLSLREFNKKAKELDFLGKDVPSIPLKKKYLINGTTYKIDSDFTKITAGQYLDFEKFSKQDEGRLENVLSVFLIPENHIYNYGYDMDKTISDILSLPITDVLAIYNFFQVAFVTCVEVLKNYFKENIKTMNKETKVEIETELKKLEMVMDVCHIF